MANKLSEPMQEVLRKLGKGWGWDDFGVHGPLSHAARVRTCEALLKRGLVAYACGDYDLTQAGEALAKQLNDQAAAASLATQEIDFTALSPVKSKEATLSEILDAVPLDSDRWKPYEHLETKAVKDKAAGKGFARQLLTGAEAYCGTVGKGYFKGRSTEPFVLHPENPGLSRLFTPQEHARIKGIPECVFAGEAETVAHEIMGQAVVYPQFVSVGAGIARLLYAAVFQHEAKPRQLLVA